MVAPETWIDFQQMLKSPNKQARAYQQNNRQRDFKHDERPSDYMSARRACPSHSVLQYTLDIVSQNLKKRNQAAGDSRKQAACDGKCQNADIQTGFSQADKIGWHNRPDQAQPGLREKNAERAAQHR